MIPFDDVLFPVALSLNSSAGPEFSTEVTETASGFEHRNQNWQGARQRFNVASSVRDLAHYQLLLPFFLARAGRARAFRFRDWSDNLSCNTPGTASAIDQQLGVGDGAKQFWQLQKTYTSGGVAYVRKITRPVLGTTTVALGGIVQATGWSVDTTTGIVTFLVPPPAPVVITAGFQFDVPARFDVDRLDPQYPYKSQVHLSDTPVVEVRE